MDANTRPPCTVRYIFILNWKWELRHLALRCNYRPFKNSGALRNKYTDCKFALGICTCNAGAHEPVRMGKRLLLFSHDLLSTRTKDCEIGN